MRIGGVWRSESVVMVELESEFGVLVVRHLELASTRQQGYEAKVSRHINRCYFAPQLLLSDGLMLPTSTSERHGDDAKQSFESSISQTGIKRMVSPSFLFSYSHIVFLFSSYPASRLLPSIHDRLLGWNRHVSNFKDISLTIVDSLDWSCCLDPASNQQLNIEKNSSRSYEGYRDHAIAGRFLQGLGFDTDEKGGHESGNRAVIS